MSEYTSDDPILAARDELCDARARRRHLLYVLFGLVLGFFVAIALCFIAPTFAVDENSGLYVFTFIGIVGGIGVLIGFCNYPWRLLGRRGIDVQSAKRRLRDERIKADSRYDPEWIVKNWSPPKPPLDRETWTRREKE